MSTRCVFCKTVCDGTLHDVYGEYMLRCDDLVVCTSCDDDLASEPGPWAEW